MKILVTGANGFVGRHLVAHLIAAGHGVTAVVRAPGRAPEGSSETIVQEIGPATDWSGLLAGHDAVIHLAARVHVMNDDAPNPIDEFRRVNTAGTAALARAAAEQGVGRLVFLSSIKVNGEATSGTPFTALDAPAPKDPYGVSKLEAETQLRSIERDTGLDVVIIRTPLVYGPGVGGNFVRILSLAKKGIPLPLGSVRNRRTMTSSWNLSDLLERAATEPAAAHGLMLAGDAHSPSTAELARQLRSAMGGGNRVFPFPPALLDLAGRATGRSAVISRLVDSLEVEAGSSATAWSWVPPYSFEDSVARTAGWYEQQQEQPRSAS